MLKKINPLVIQSTLFILTIFTTTLVGAQWIGIEKPEDSFWDFFSRGFSYSLPFIGILTVHELGHYFVAKYYKVDVTLPYYIPFYIPSFIQIGTLGAFIKMKSRSSSKKEIFDIGVAGPLAGFIAALIILTYGFTNLPEREYIFNIHKSYSDFEQDKGIPFEQGVYTYEFQKNAHKYAHALQQIEDSIYFANNTTKGFLGFLQNINLADKEWKRKEFQPQPSYQELAVGKNLIFLFFEKYVVQDKSRIPNIYEMYHYPIIFAGFLALFFTALNLIPIGQLDGGHVIYGLFGYRKHKLISTTLFTLFLFVAGIGIFKSNILGIDFFSASLFDMIFFTTLYLYFLYFVLIKTYKDFRTTLMISVIIFSVQFFIEYAFPSFEGLNGWFVFTILLGRFLGTEHPPAFVEEPLDLKRKLIGWFSLVVFILCFTPQIVILQEFK